MPQMTLYLSKGNRAAFDEVRDKLGTGISATARQIFLIGLRAERRRLGLEDTVEVQPTKRRKDADALGVPTTNDAARGIGARKYPHPVRIPRAILERPQPSTIDVVADIVSETRAEMRERMPWTPPTAPVGE